MAHRKGKQAYASGLSSGASTYAHGSGGVTPGLNKVTYGKQPSWAFAEQHKNTHGQYQAGMFSHERAQREAGTPSPSYKSSPSPSYSRGSSSPSYSRGGGGGGGASFCSGCGTKQTPGTKFCPGCGKASGGGGGGPPSCRKCGVKKTLSSAKFCSSCGTSY